MVQCSLACSSLNECGGPLLVRSSTLALALGVLTGLKLFLTCM